jgi:two-component system, chemotaxis family, response regulator Rcp1
MSSEHGKAINILLVEDNEPDVVLTREAFREAKISNSLFVVEDGAEAMHFLYRRGKYSEMPRPDLILLDLNLPKKDGRAVLAEIKSDPELTSIPVVILTTSSDEKDVIRAYTAHANCYIIKPVDFLQFMGIVRSIEGFWLTVVRLPDSH